jgi:hypothetical protein
MPRAISIAPEHHVSGPTCLARNDLPIQPWHVEVTPGLLKCGTKWQF